MIQTIDQAPGIYFGVPYAEYETWKGANNSLLRILGEDTPAHLYHALQSGEEKEETDAMALGTFVHRILLEPEKVLAETAVRPASIKQRRGAAWERFAAENEGKQIVTEAMAAKASKMARRLLESEMGQLLFNAEGRQTEVCIVWVNQETGVLCKARTDLMATPAGWPTVLADMKTAARGARRPMEGAVVDYAYHTQASHILDGLATHYPGNHERKWLLGVVESRAPYEPAWYELEDGALEVAQGERLSWLATWDRCMKSGNWPGYGVGVEYLGLPSWKMKVWDAKN